GKQIHNKIPLARSEMHLLELLEDVCDRMDDYALYMDSQTKKKNYKRFAPRGNEKVAALDFGNFFFDPRSSESFKFACETIAEEYEDEIISLFAQEADHVADKLCTEKSGTVSDVTGAFS
uniref:Canopy FGF signaling regulator 1 n=1 Tax=Latimeria chalumnae TaxID=7897 RepID=H3A2A0_LATCH